MLHEPPLIKSRTDIKQFVKQSLHLNYPNHTQSVERAAKLTTTVSGRIAGSKRKIGEALCTAGNKIKTIIAICIALTLFFFVMHHFMQTVKFKRKRKC